MTTSVLSRAKGALAEPAKHGFGSDGTKTWPIMICEVRADDLAKLIALADAVHAHHRGLFGPISEALKELTEETE